MAFSFNNKYIKLLRQINYDCYSYFSDEPIRELLHLQNIKTSEVNDRTVGQNL